MRASAPRRTRPTRSNSAATRCSSTPRSPNRTTRAGWRPRCAPRSKPGASRASPDASPSAASPSRRARNSASSAPDPAQNCLPGESRDPSSNRFGCRSSLDDSQFGRRATVIFALPLYDDNPIRQPPVVTYALIGMCVGAFLWQLGQDPEIVAYQFGMVPAVLFGYRELAPELRSEEHTSEL